MSNPQVKAIHILEDSPAGDGWFREWDLGARTIGGAKRSINKICIEWNAYFGQYEFSIVAKDKCVSAIYSRKVQE